MSSIHEDEAADLREQLKAVEKTLHETEQALLLREDWLDNLRKRSKELEADNQKWQRQLAQQQKVVEGLEHLLKNKQRAISALPIGTVVKLPDNSKGVITGISLDRGGVKYWVVWWVAGKRIEDLLDTNEIEEYNADVEQLNTGSATINVESFMRS